MVEQREYRVRSSDGQSSYVVGFWWDGEHLYVKCSCRAGIVGQGCRHKDAILAGDTSVLFEDADIREIAEWIERSAVGFALRRVN